MSLQSVSFQRARQGTVLAASGTGLQVTASSGMTVSIAAGTYFLGGKTIVYAGANVTSDTADPTNARYDVVVLDINGTASIVKGTAAASPTVPLYKDDVMPVAILVITAADATIASGDIIDVRDLAGISVDGTTISISAGGVISVIPGGITGFPTVVASGSGTRSVVGDGSAQNIFSDTFTALADGEVVVGTIHLYFTATTGSDTPDFTFRLGGVIFKTLSAVNLGTTNSHFVRFTYSKHATAELGYGIVEEVAHSATGTAALSIAKNDATYSSAINSVSATVDPAVSTTVSARYNYCVTKYSTGV